MFFCGANLLLLSLVEQLHHFDWPALTIKKWMSIWNEIMLNFDERNIYQNTFTDSLEFFSSEVAAICFDFMSSTIATLSLETLFLWFKSLNHYTRPWTSSNGQVIGFHVGFHNDCRCLSILPHTDQTLCTCMQFFIRYHASFGFEND